MPRPERNCSHNQNGPFHVESTPRLKQLLSASLDSKLGSKRLPLPDALTASTTPTVYLMSIALMDSVNYVKVFLDRTHLTLKCPLIANAYELIRMWNANLCKIGLGYRRNSGRMSAPKRCQNLEMNRLWLLPIRKLIDCNNPLWWLNRIIKVYVLAPSVETTIDGSPEAPRDGKRLGKLRTEDCRKVSSRRLFRAFPQIGGANICTDGQKRIWLTIRIILCNWMTTRKTSPSTVEILDRCRARPF